MFVLLDVSPKVVLGIPMPNLLRVVFCVRMLQKGVRVQLDLDFEGAQECVDSL